MGRPTATATKTGSRWEKWLAATTSGPAGTRSPPSQVKGKKRPSRTRPAITTPREAVYPPRGSPGLVRGSKVGKEGGKGQLRALVGLQGGGGGQRGQCRTGKVTVAHRRPELGGRGVAIPRSQDLQAGDVQYPARPLPFPLLPLPESPPHRALLVPLLAFLAVAAPGGGGGARRLFRLHPPLAQGGDHFVVGDPAEVHRAAAAGDGQRQVVLGLRHEDEDRGRGRLLEGVEERAG